MKTMILTIAGITMASSAYSEGLSYEIEVGVSREPAYVGSDTYVTEPELSFTATYTDSNDTEWFFGLGGAGTRFAVSPEAEVELTLEYEPGRSNEDDPILKGLTEQEDTVELQAVYLRDFGLVDLGFGVQADVLGRGKGLVGFVGARYDVALTDRLQLTAGLDFSFANSEHMNTEVGITTAQSAATGIAAYDAPGGYKGATLSIEMEYAMTDALAIYGDASFESYGNAIANSPLVEQFGSSTTNEIGMGVRYSF